MIGIDWQEISFLEWIGILVIAVVYCYWAWAFMTMIRMNKPKDK